MQLFGANQAFNFRILSIYRVPKVIINTIQKNIYKYYKDHHEY